MNNNTNCNFDNSAFELGIKMSLVSQGKIFFTDTVKFEYEGIDGRLPSPEAHKCIFKYEDRSKR